ncbi:MAG TPA: hypothetical protein VMY37_32875 [Thermoguttaceae bacterium]|nr:hypothetical protein [Thermoguttaceae bacterium]
MRKRSLGILACLLAGWMTASSRAAIVLPKGDGPPIAGFVVHEDSAKIVLREQLADGTFKDREIMRSQIDAVIVTVSAERLESLRPDDPSGYRDYAEELAEKRKDPEARATAVRLYLIAAHLAPEKLGRSCLMGIAALADNPADVRKFRAVAYLLDPAHNRELLKRSDLPVPPAETAADTDPSELVDALRLLRQGKYGLALGKAESAEPLFDRYGQFLSYREFIETCKAAPGSGPSDDLLRRILHVELTLSEPPASDDNREPPRDAPSADWLRIVTTGGHVPVPSLSLDTITEIDPRKCVFRRGRWAEP